MSTENEKKYVLNIQGMDTVFFEEADITNTILIDQAYIQTGKGWTYRIRRSIVKIDGELKISYQSCFKKKVTDRVIEIESKIDLRDYNDLYETTDITLQKVRHLIEDNGLVWEIDFFYVGVQTDIYFVMAEVELPEGVEAPERIPEILLKHLVHEVGIGEKGFSSKKLCSTEYANGLYERLTGVVD